MIDIQNTKKLGHFLAQNLKDKDVKQSEILELISKFNGFKNWNAMSAVKKEQNSNLLQWTNPCHIHKDNGGLTVSYNPFRQILKLEAGFFGYSDHAVNISMKITDLKNFQNALLEFSNHSGDENNIKTVEITESLKIEDFYLKYEDLNTEFGYSLHNNEIPELLRELKNIVEVSKVLKEISEKPLRAYFKKSGELIGKVNSIEKFRRNRITCYECEIDNNCVYDIDLLKFNGYECEIDKNFIYDMSLLKFTLGDEPFDLKKALGVVL